MRRRRRRRKMRDTHDADDLSRKSVKLQPPNSYTTYLITVTRTQRGGGVGRLQRHAWGFAQRLNEAIVSDNRLKRVQHGHDVGVLQAPEQGDFAQRTQSLRRILAQLVAVDFLDGHVSLSYVIEGFHDRAVDAGAQHRLRRVARRHAPLRLEVAAGHAVQLGAGLRDLGHWRATSAARVCFECAQLNACRKDAEL